MAAAGFHNGKVQAPDRAGHRLLHRVGRVAGYAIQGRAAAFVSSINGSYTNVVGLCVYVTSGLLEAALAHAAASRPCTSER